MTVPLDRLDLARGVDAAFTGRAPRGRADDPGGMHDPANLAHHRPHVPSLLAAARRQVARDLSVEVEDLHLMRQVHGDDVGVVTGATPRGAELRAVDAMVTAVPGRVLVVQAADCLPVLLAFDGGPVGVAHAGRAGVALGVLDRVVDAMLGLAPGRTAADLHVAVGPAIGGCCYEVPDRMAADVHDEVAARQGPEAAAVAVARTTWGSTSLDLPAVATAQLRAAGVRDVRPSPACTHCEPERGWFSHRRSPSSGRHWGVVVQSVGSAHEVAA